jgi:hypothetical protein
MAMKIENWPMEFDLPATAVNLWAISVKVPEGKQRKRCRKVMVSL